MIVVYLSSGGSIDYTQLNILSLLLCAIYVSCT